MNELEKLLDFIEEKRKHITKCKDDYKWADAMDHAFKMVEEQLKRLNCPTRTLWVLK